MRVAVVIVNWNGGQLLERCLDCLARQTRAPSRIVVVDNASSDRSLASIAARHPGVETIELPTNEGFARANNIAIRAVDDCDWVALLNPDAFPDPEWLEMLVRAANEHPECASFGSHMRMAGTPDRIDGIGDVYHVSGVAWRDRHGLPESDVRGPADIFSACAAAAMYRRDAFLDAGGFDESYFCYFEDVDLGFRLRLRGHRCLYVPDAVVHHVASASLGYRSPFALYHGHRNQIWTYVKNMPAGMLALYLPQHLLWNLLSLCVISFERGGGIIRASKWDAVRGLPAALRQRPAIQAGRRISAGELRKSMATGFLMPYRRHLRSFARRVGAS